jgi:lipopolysaccharide transport system ATP-binding protein
LSDVVIRAEGLGKKYLIGHQGERESYVALRDVIARNLRGFVRSAGDVLRGRQLIEGDEVEEFWALKDVGFEVKRGEVLGIIGRNGAGKSTLLKILSRITEPSAGRVEIRGRVASLLEVGTGFHPELTGRENVYLNGAILGMSRAEIKRKFDEIVAFAEVEKFLDTPVKRYSSGMYVRLAFAVAAHLEPEILVIDEVLAVGDAQFQKKCLGKMEEVGKEGRTVLFVSHNLSAVRNMCTRALLLSRGRLQCDDEVGVAIQRYMSEDSLPAAFVSLKDHPGRRAKPDCHVLTSIALKTDPNLDLCTDTFATGAPLTVEVSYSAGGEIYDYMVIGIESLLDQRIATVGTHLSSAFASVFCGNGKAICQIERLNLTEGEYKLLVAIGTRDTMTNIDFVEDAVRFSVRLGDYFGTGQTILPGQGIIALKSNWSVQEERSDEAVNVRETQIIYSHTSR